jgi:hypothetical protein
MIKYAGRRETMSIGNLEDGAIKKLYNIPDAASLCGSLSPWTLRKHISRGTIHVTRIGRRVFLRSEEIERIRREGLPSLRGGANGKPKDEHGSMLRGGVLTK